MPPPPPRNMDFPYSSASGSVSLPPPYLRVLPADEKIRWHDCQICSQCKSQSTRGSRCLKAGTQLLLDPIQIDKDVGVFIDVVKKYGASIVDGLTIGNEVADTPTNIMKKVWDVRGYLHDKAGYKGPVSTVPVWVNAVNNPILCDADRVTVNAHAFYDGHVQAAGAGGFITNTVIPQIKKACAKYPAVKDIVITESGWPSRGANFGVAVPSLANEQAALRSLNCAAKSTKIIAFEADDSTWKNANANEQSMSLVQLRIGGSGRR